MKTKILLLLFVVINLSFVGWFAYHRSNPVADQSFEPDVIDTGDGLFTNGPLPHTIELPDLAKEINEKNKKIKSLYCSKMTIQTWDHSFGYRLSGTLAFEKDKRFNMTISSLFGTELNIGSNDELFWYWSARDIKPGVYWAKHEDFNKTRLKTPFDPAFLRGSLGLDELTTDGLERVIQGKESTLLIYKTKSSTDEPLTKHVHLDATSKTIYYTDIIDKKGRHVSSRVLSLENGLPKDITFFWQEERRAMKLTLNKVKKNATISTTFWKLPDREPKINMID